MKNKAIFLDRDGVINILVPRNEGYYSPRFFSEFQLYDDVEKTLTYLKRKKYLLIIISNQPDISRGKMSIKELEKIDNFLYKNLPIDDIYYSYDSNYEKGSSKKPSPIMILDAQKKWDINLSESFFVGDSVVDKDCAKNSSISFIGIERDHNKDLFKKNLIYSLNEIEQIIH